VVFTGGLSARGAWSGAGSCSNLYCHGNGQGDNGSYGHTQATPTCGTCHAWENSSEGAIAKMSGRHHTHVWDEGVACATCHAATVSGAAITDVNKHLNGTPDVRVGAGGESVVWNGASCTGTCHGQRHSAERW
jgi:predicted CxxxxCH...CXXCH cytochrome family protein